MEPMQPSAAAAIDMQLPNGLEALTLARFDDMSRRGFIFYQQTEAERLEHNGFKVGRSLLQTIMAFHWISALTTFPVVRVQDRVYLQAKANHERRCARAKQSSRSLHEPKTRGKSFHCGQAPPALVEQVLHLQADACSTHNTLRAPDGRSRHVRLDSRLCCTSSF